MSSPSCRDQLAMIGRNCCDPLSRNVCVPGRGESSRHGDHLTANRIGAGEKRIADTIGRRGIRALRVCGDVDARGRRATGLVWFRHRPAGAFGRGLRRRSALVTGDLHCRSSSSGSPASPSSADSSSSFPVVGGQFVQLLGDRSQLTAQANQCRLLGDPLGADRQDSPAPLDGAPSTSPATPGDEHRDQVTGAARHAQDRVSLHRRHPGCPQVTFGSERSRPEVHRLRAW